MRGRINRKACRTDTGRHRPMRHDGVGLRVDFGDFILVREIDVERSSTIGDQKFRGTVERDGFFTLIRLEVDRHYRVRIAARDENLVARRVHYHAIGIFQRPGSNALQMASAVYDTMERLKKDFRFRSGRRRIGRRKWTCCEATKRRPKFICRTIIRRASAKFFAMRIWRGRCSKLRSMDATRFIKARLRRKSWRPRSGMAAR